MGFVHFSMVFLLVCNIEYLGHILGNTEVLVCISFIFNECESTIESRASKS